MKKKVRVFLFLAIGVATLVVLWTALTAHLQQWSAREYLALVKADGGLAKYRPPNGFVPDKETAIAIAVAACQISLFVANGEYGYAGLLYWDAFTRVAPGDDEALRHLLYCLERLNVPQIKAFFKPEYSAGFDKIEQARRQRMEENSVYRAMQKKQ